MPHKYFQRAAETPRVKKGERDDYEEHTSPPVPRELRKAKIHYQLAQHRDGAIMVKVAVPGERWEVEFVDDCSVEAEVFRSDGTIHNGSILDNLIRQHSSV